MFNSMDPQYTDTNLILILDFYSVASFVMMEYLTQNLVII